MCCVTFLDARAFITGGGGGLLSPESAQQATRRKCVEIAVGHMAELVFFVCHMAELAE